MRIDIFKRKFVFENDTIIILRLIALDDFNIELFVYDDQN